MNKNKIKAILIFLLLVPLVVSLILSCTNFNTIGTTENENDFVDTLYVPDTNDNREKFTVEKTSYYVYVCLFGFISLAGVTYLYIRAVKER